MKQFRMITAALVLVAVVAFSTLYNVGISYAGSLSNLSDSLSTYVASQDADHTIQFTLATLLNDDGSKIVVSFPAGFSLTGVTEDDTDIAGSVTGELTTAADCSGSEEVGVAISGQDITFTICSGDGGDLTATEVVTIEIGTNATASGTGANQIDNHATPNSYAISIATKTSGDVNIDSGSVAIPILSDEQVSVSGTVDPSLTFAIRNSADSGTTNSCALGILATGSVSTCAYRLAISTNATGGFTAKVTSDGDLRTATSDTITAIAEDGTVSAGTEGYGVAITGATSLTEEGDFSDDDTPIPTSATSIVSAGGPYEYVTSTLTTSTLVTHRAAISALTEAGSYTQTLTYTVTGSF